MIKETILKIPIIGKLVKKIVRKIKRPTVFTTSGNYWEERYKTGGNSGAGSYNNLAEFKAEVINSIVQENNISTVIEYGCGDGNQLKYFEFPSYLGFDVSKTAVQSCQNIYSADSSKQFKLVSDYTNESADLTMSLDVVYHLIEDEVYEDYMKRLFLSSKNIVIVYSSNTDNNDKQESAPHVKHRNFTNWVDKNASNFRLIQHIPNKYKFDGNGKRTSFADFYIFQKQS